MFCLCAICGSGAGRRSLATAAAGLVLALAAPAQEETSAVPPAGALRLEAADRILVLAPHPDDESLCTGGVIQRALAQKLPVRVVWLTYGDNNQWSFALYRMHPVLMPAAVRAMGQIRCQEALAAGRRLGLAPEQMVTLGYPDFGAMDIWERHWGGAPACESMFTHVEAVPYANAYRPGAPYKGEEILRDLETILRDFRPTKVFVSHPADRHNDHVALYLFTRVALWNLEGELRPQLYPALVHYRRWPAPRGDEPDRPLLPPAGFHPAIAWTPFELTPAEVQVKREAIRLHRTQFEYAGSYLFSFLRSNELFGDLPEVRLGEVAPAPRELGGPAATGEGEDEERLTDRERTLFVGLEWRAVRRDGDALAMTLHLSRPLAEAVSVSMYAFGYDPAVPFAQMPKLHLRLGALRETVTDQETRLADSGIEIRRDLNEIVARIPFAALHHPRKILISARSYLSEVPLDFSAWRIVDAGLRE